jgi:osmotically-inducible protein OsmY
MMRIANDHATHDEDLRTAVLREIEWRPDIHSQDINVKVSGSAVALAGFVHTLAEKKSAEEAAKSVRGVISIANDIDVRPSTRTDPEIARDLQRVLRSHFMIPETKITATVRGGIVTLEGTVEWNYQKTSAVDAAGTVRGVLGVCNLIAVKPRVSPAPVKDEIDAALRRSAKLDAKSIYVSAHGSTVELSGGVHSFSEREGAERAAWAAPGIESVVNLIQVVY